MLDFEKEVLHHAAGQIDAAVAQQSEDDEVAVPTVHFVESATRNHVLVLEIEQAGSDLGRIDLSGRGDDCGKRLYLNFAALLQVLHRRGCGEVSRQVEDRSL